MQYFDQIRNLVYDEHKCLYIKDICKLFNLHLSEATRVVDEFIEKENINGNNLDVTYTLSGYKNDDNDEIKLQRFITAKAEALNESKKYFSTFFGSKVRCIEKKSIDDQEIAQTSDENSTDSITNEEELKNRQESTLITNETVSFRQDLLEKYFLVSSSKKRENERKAREAIKEEKSDTNSKTGNDVNKARLNGKAKISNFFGKSKPSQENDNSKDGNSMDNSNSTNQVKKEAESSKKPLNDFETSNNSKVEKMEEDESLQNGDHDMRGIFDDDLEEEKDEENDNDEDEGVMRKIKQSKPEQNKRQKKSKNKKESNKSNKKRKRIRMLDDSDSEEKKSDEENENKESYEIEPKAKSIKLEDKPKQIIQSQVVDETFVDEDGYLVTKKCSKMVSVDDNEKSEEKIETKSESVKQKVKNNDDQQEGKKEVKKEDKEVKEKKPKESKAKQNKLKPGQTSITSFFKVGNR